MWGKTGLAMTVAVAAVLAFQPAQLLGAGTAQVAGGSTCVQCCEGDAVCEALAGLADLRATVGELVPEAGLANSLDAKLDAAMRSVLASRPGAAVNQLDAFGNEVTAAEQSRKLSGTTSNILKTKHDTVKNSISNIH